MIKKKTLKHFGYTSDSLSYDSSKKVIALCDKCGMKRILKFYSYKNLCRYCANIGRKHTEESKRQIKGNYNNINEGE